MRFHFKNPKTKEETIEQKKELLPTTVIQEWQPKCPPVAQYEMQEMQVVMPLCADEEKYIALYEACFAAEMERMQTHYNENPDYLAFCKLFRDRMMAFLKKERELKVKFNYKAEDYYEKSKRFHLLGRLREYESQTLKLQKAKRQIEMRLNEEMKLDLQGIKNQGFDEIRFKGQMRDFENKQKSFRVEMSAKLVKYLQKLRKEREELQEENERLEKEIEEFHEVKDNPYRKKYSLWL